MCSVASSCAVGEGKPTVPAMARDCVPQTRNRWINKMPYPWAKMAIIFLCVFKHKCMFHWNNVCFVARDRWFFFCLRHIPLKLRRLMTSQSHIDCQSRCMQPAEAAIVMCFHGFAACTLTGLTGLESPMVILSAVTEYSVEDCMMHFIEWASNHIQFLINR